MNIDRDSDVSMEPVRISLYGFPTSPYVVKVAAYLGYKKLNYQFVGVNPLNFEQIAFTNQRQVPVLKIGNQWRKDSDDIALWLEEYFPQKPLLPKEELEKAEIFRLNHWVNHTVVPGMFRLTVDWPSVPVGLSNGWKLAKSVNQSVEIPKWVQLMWPVLIRNARFIRRIVESQDRNETVSDFQRRVLNEFVDHLDNGPFLAGRTEPSLADVSLYPLVLFGDALKLKGDTPWNDSADVQNWADRMSEYFDEHLLPIELQAGRLDWGRVT